MNELDFSGRQVLVVGGSSGIGNGVAQAFRAHGARVAVCGTRAKASDYSPDEGSRLDGLDYFQLDDSDVGAIEKFNPPLARLDVLVLAQGAVIYRRGEFAMDGFRAVLEVNLMSLMACATKFHSQLRAASGALIIVSSAKNTIEVIKAIRKHGGTTQIMTLSNNSSLAFVKELGPAGIGVIITQITPAPHLLTTPLGQEFKKAAQASGATVSYAAMEGYVSAKVMVEGLRRAGRNLTREGFVHAMESMHHTDFGGLMVNYGPDDHSGSEFVELTMIGKDGRIIR